MEKLKGPEAKKKRIFELIRLTLLQPEQLDPILPIMVHQAIALSGKGEDVQEVSRVVKERIGSDAFIDRFFGVFDEVFTEVELLQLVFFHSTEVMKKFSKYRMKLFHPMYSAYREVIEDVLVEFSKEVNVKLVQIDKFIGGSYENRSHDASSDACS